MVRAAVVALVATGLAVVVARAFGIPHMPLYAVLMASSSAALVLPVIDSLGLGGPNVIGLLPQVAPVMLSQILYTLESSTRSATILGVVGAGGIGLALSDRIRINNWDEAAFIILMILATVAVIDLASRTLRLRLIRP